MRTYRGLTSIPIDDDATVATVGFFDGVHRGHQAVLARAVAAGRDRGIPTVAVTFDRHPREVLTPGREPRLLTTAERKAELIEAAGIDVLVVLEFTHELSLWSPEEFVRRVLVEGVRATHAVLGANFTFGHRAAGDVSSLVELGAPDGLTAEGVDLLQLHGQAVSSSSIREALAAGNLEWPTTALGRRFVLDGEVVPGAGRGEGLGFPTANLRTWPRLLLPGSGIYAGVARLEDGRRLVAAISVGTNPTFGSEPLHAEAHLLDYPGGSLLGKGLALELRSRLRDERRFSSSEELSCAIASDVQRTRELVTDAELGGS